MAIENQIIRCKVKDKEIIKCVVKEEIIRVTIEDSGSGVVENFQSLLDNFLIKEDLTTQVTQGKIEFTLSNKYVSGSIKVFVNGLKERIIIEVSGNIKIRLTTGLEIDDSIEVEYIKDES